MLGIVRKIQTIYFCDDQVWNVKALNYNCREFALIGDIGNDLGFDEHQGSGRFEEVNLQ